MKVEWILRGARGQRRLLMLLAEETETLAKENFRRSDWSNLRMVIDDKKNDDGGSSKWKSFISLPPRAAKTNKSSSFFLSPIRRKTNSGAEFSAFSHRTRKRAEKIKYRWKNHSPKKKKERKKEKRKVVPLASIFLFISRGGFISHLEWENLLFIFGSETTRNCYSFCILWRLSSNVETVQVSFIFSTTVWRAKKENILEMTIKAVGAIKSKHLRSWATLEIEIKRPFSFEFRVEEESLLPFPRWRQ